MCYVLHVVTGPIWDSGRAALCRRERGTVGRMCPSKRSSWRGCGFVIEPGCLYRRSDSFVVFLQVLTVEISGLDVCRAVGGTEQDGVSKGGDGIYRSAPCITVTAQRNPTGERTCLGLDREGDSGYWSVSPQRRTWVTTCSVGYRGRVLRWRIRLDETSLSWRTGHTKYDYREKSGWMDGSEYALAFRRRISCTTHFHEQTRRVLVRLDSHELDCRRSVGIAVLEG